MSKTDTPAKVASNDPLGLVSEARRLAAAVDPLRRVLLDNLTLAVAAKALDAAADEIEHGAAALALLKRIRYHAERHALPRDWLTAADEVLGTWGPVKLDHPELKA